MLIDTQAAFLWFLRELARQELVAYDVETTGLKIWHGDYICGFSVAFADGRSFYLPIAHAQSVPVVEFVKEKTGRGGTSKRRVERNERVERTFSQLVPAALVQTFEIITLNGIRLITHNGKFDVHMTENEGIDCSDITIYDTMVMAKIANNIEITAALKKLAVKYIDKNANDEEQTLKKTLRDRGWLYKAEGRGDVAHYDWMEPAEMAPYAEKDALLTYALYRIMHERIASSKQMTIFKRETELLPVLVSMERHGMRVDLDFCREALVTIKQRIATIEESIFALAGEEFDIASAQQLGVVMRRLGVESAVKTVTGRESWAKNALAPSRSVSPIVPLVEEWRSLTKSRTTYLENFLLFADKDGVIHGDIQQIEAKTGRTSIRDPSLQNITKKEKDGVELRRAFIPEPGCVLVLVDWSQQEARIMADWSGETALLDAIRDGKDIHTLTAMRLSEALNLGLCGDLACKTMATWRDRSKITFFALMYGVGVDKLAGMLGIDVNVAANVRSAFWSTYPKVARFASTTRREASTLGFVRNKYGRMYRYPEAFNPATEKAEFQYAYTAVDHKIQGTGADMAKEALIKVWRGLRASGMGASLVGFLHDELILDVPYDEVDKVVRNVTRIMTNYGDIFKVPIAADASIAETSWADKRPYQHP